MSANRILFLTFVPFISSLSFAYENCNHFQTPYDRAYCQTKLLVQSEQDVKSAYEAVFKKLTMAELEDDLKDVQDHWTSWRTDQCSEKDEIDLICATESNQVRAKQLKKLSSESANISSLIGIENFQRPFDEQLEKPLSDQNQLQWIPKWISPKLNGKLRFEYFDNTHEELNTNQTFVRKKRGIPRKLEFIPENGSENKLSFNFGPEYIFDYFEKADYLEPGNAFLEIKIEDGKLITAVGPMLDSAWVKRVLTFLNENHGLKTPLLDKKSEAEKIKFLYMVTRFCKRYQITSEAHTVQIAFLDSIFGFKDDLSEDMRKILESKIPEGEKVMQLTQCLIKQRPSIKN